MRTTPLPTTKSLKQSQADIHIHTHNTNLLVQSSWHQTVSFSINGLKSLL